MTTPATRIVRVDRIRAVAPRVKEFTLVAADENRCLPAFSAGSHIVLSLGDGRRSWRNSYSLIGDPAESGRYRIAVQKAVSDRTRGGSHYLHDYVAEGHLVEIGMPVNFFPLARGARHHVMIAGGIGITPFLSQLACLKPSGASYELHYAFREDGAFQEALCHDHGGRVHFYDSSAGDRMDISRILRPLGLGTHVYVCGPHRLMADVSDYALALGWPADHIHTEEFAPPPASDNRAFRVVVPSLGATVDVAPNETLLDAMEVAGVPIASSCRIGRCGTCQISVLDGEVDHRDRCLTDEERASGLMLACVSRACAGSLLVEPEVPGGLR